MAFQKAVRRRVFVKLALTGPSGSGKSLSALLLARGIAGPEGRIAVIDTENNSASYYSDRVEFDTDAVAPPYTVAKYVASINEAVAQGYHVLVIDSLSHAWAGEGGLLAQKESLDARGGNSFTNWAGITKQHESFKAAVLQSPIHIIATMRSKQEYVVEQSERGKSAPRKVGLAPVQREGMEYEFGTVLDIAMNHEATTTKDRTGLFDGLVGVLTEDHGRQIREWRESAPDQAIETPNPPAPLQPARAPQPAPANGNGHSPNPVMQAAIKAFVESALDLGIEIANKTDRENLLIDILFEQGLPDRPLTPADYNRGADRLREKLAQRAVDQEAAAAVAEPGPPEALPLSPSSPQPQPMLATAPKAAPAAKLTNDQKNDSARKAAAASKPIATDDLEDPFADDASPAPMKRETMEALL